MRDVKWAILGAALTLSGGAGAGDDSVLVPLDVVPGAALSSGDTMFTNISEGGVRTGNGASVTLPMNGAAPYCSVTLVGGGGGAGGSTDNGGYDTHGFNGAYATYTGFATAFTYWVGQGGTGGHPGSHENHSGSGGGGGAASRVIMYLNGNTVQDLWAVGGAGGQGSYAETPSKCRFPPEPGAAGGTSSSPLGKNGRIQANASCNDKASTYGFGGTYTSGGGAISSAGQGAPSVNAAWKHGASGSSGMLYWRCFY